MSIGGSTVVSVPVSGLQATRSTRDPGSSAYCSQQYGVHFGTGTAAQLGKGAERLGIRRALLLTTREREAEGRRLPVHLGQKLAGSLSHVRMHTRVEVTDAALEVVEAKDIDGLVAIGRGSTVGLGKALAYRTALLQGLDGLGRLLELPGSVAAIRMPEDGIVRAADVAVRSPYANPGPVDCAAVREVIAPARRGDAPRRL